jgi:hypothetical protein
MARAFFVIPERQKLTASLWKEAAAGKGESERAGVPTIRIVDGGA